MTKEERLEICRAKLNVVKQQGHWIDPMSYCVETHGADVESGVCLLGAFCGPHGGHFRAGALLAMEELSMTGDDVERLEDGFLGDDGGDDEPCAIGYQLRQEYVGEA